MIKIIINLVNSSHAKLKIIKIRFVHQIRFWDFSGINSLIERGEQISPWNTAIRISNLRRMKHVVSHISSNRRQDTTANSLACQIWTNQFPNNPERNKRQYIRSVRGQNKWFCKDVPFCLSSVFDTLIMTCATYKLSLNHKTSVTVMFSKAVNFTKDKSKSDLICILTAGIENLHTVAVVTNRDRWRRIACDQRVYSCYNYFLLTNFWKWLIYFHTLTVANAFET